mmetsp:Transcript_221/g.467  ORF Transcript_221/g.467 Transcript_221/m.467 type:complete len:293 (+) Transcript_221:1393-2271(+)
MLRSCRTTPSATDAASLGARKLTNSSKETTPFPSSSCSLMSAWTCFRVYFFSVTASRPSLSSCASRVPLPSASKPLNVWCARLRKSLARTALVASLKLTLTDVTSSSAINMMNSSKSIRPFRSLSYLLIRLLHCSSVYVVLLVLVPSGGSRNLMNSSKSTRPLLSLSNVLISSLHSLREWLFPVIAFRPILNSFASRVPLPSLSISLNVASARVRKPSAAIASRPFRSSSALRRPSPSSSIFLNVSFAVFRKPWLWVMLLGTTVPSLHLTIVPEYHLDFSLITGVSLSAWFR